MPLDLEGIAELVVQTVDTAQGPVVARVAALETATATAAARLEELAFIRLALETLRAESAAVRERVAVIETRPPVPGPAGKDGEPGPAGKDGADGKPGLAYVGVYQDGKAYEPGECATWAGSLWHCNEATRSRPGDGAAAWTLVVKRGRDGKDGKP